MYTTDKILLWKHYYGNPWLVTPKGFKVGKNSKK